MADRRGTGLGDGNAPRARAYAAARRHSGRVRALKFAIPLASAAAVALVAFVSIADPFGRIGAGLSLGPLSVSGTKITMEAPRLTGYRSDARPYEVTASAATQDVRKPNVIELKEMRARLGADEGGGAARLEAALGVVDTTKEQLELRQDITVRMNDGQQARLKSASVDFKAGTVVSREPVAVTMTNGTIEADSLDVSENGKVVAFTGRVRAVFASPEAGGSLPLARTTQAEPPSLRP